MKRLPFFWALAFGCLFLKGDGNVRMRADDGEPVVGLVRASTCEKTQAPLTAITWNVALAPGMNPLYKPRIAPVIEAVRSLKYDVLCVQEAWLEKDKRAIIAASGLPPDNVFVHDTAGLGEDEADTCDSPAFELVQACARASCLDEAVEDTSLCTMQNCDTELKLLYTRDRRCLNCLAAKVGNSASDISNACTNGSASRVYGGNNGVMLLSRWPLHDRQVVFIPSSNANRVALLARLHVPGLTQPLEVACSHLSSPQPITPSHSGFVTWDDEQRAQIQAIAGPLEARAQGRPQLFLGDMNFGAGDNVRLRSYMARSDDDALRAGFHDPAAEADPPFCSVCGDNTLRGAHGDMGMLFDHVLFRDPAGGAELRPVCADRLLDQRVRVNDFHGVSVSTHLSDHFAVRVKFDLK